VPFVGRRSHETTAVTAGGTMNTTNGRTKIGKGLLAALLFGLVFGLAAVPALAEHAPGPDTEGPVRTTLERVSDALKTLEAELAAMQAPVAERLEESVEKVIEALDGVLTRMDEGAIDRDDPAVRKKLVEINMRLHRLIYRLGEVAEGDARPESPQQIQRMLGRFVERLEALAFRFDGFILRQSE
jgi:hypothetical protein